mgnify:CR=1 FL=1
MGSVTEGDAVDNHDRQGNLRAQGAPVKRHFAADEYELYIQDSFRIKPNLTITYGLRYEPASATSSAAVMVGSWVTHTLFLAYRQHLAPRPDENNGEADLEYWFKRRYMIEAVAGDRGKQGLDLLWRRRW